VISVQAAARVEINHDRTLLNLNSEALYREMLKWFLLSFPKTSWFQSFIWKNLPNYGNFYFKIENFTLFWNKRWRVIIMFLIFWSKL